MARGTNFKFGSHAPRYSPDVTHKKLSRKAWVTCHFNFWQLNANSSRKTNAKDLKFGIFALVTVPT